MTKASDKKLIKVDDEHAVAKEKAPEPKVELKPKKKVETIPVEERQGHAIAKVDVPARTAEVPLAHSKIDGVVSATVEAWHAVKGKDDAEFARCVAEFRRELINHAEEVFQTGVTTEGDTVMAQFERAVAKINLREADKAAKAKAA